MNKIQFIDANGVSTIPYAVKVPVGAVLSNGVIDLSAVPAGAFTYEAVLTQASTAAPVATVAFNTIAGTLTWARTSAGIYTLTSGGTPFTANKTQIYMGSMDAAVLVGQLGKLTFTRTSTSVITVQTYLSDLSGPSVGATDDLLTETAFRVVITA